IISSSSAARGRGKPSPSSLPITCMRFLYCCSGPPFNHEITRTATRGDHRRQTSEWPARARLARLGGLKNSASKQDPLTKTTAQSGGKSRPCEGSEGGRRCPMKPRPAIVGCSAWSGRRERTDRNVISVRISERELLGLSVRIHVWFLFEPSDERACPLKRQVEIIDTEEQQEPVAGCPVIGTPQ